MWCRHKKPPKKKRNTFEIICANTNVEHDITIWCFHARSKRIGNIIFTAVRKIYQNIKSLYSSISKTEQQYYENNCIPFWHDLSYRIEASAQRPGQSEKPTNGTLRILEVNNCGRAGDTETNGRRTRRYEEPVESLYRKPNIVKPIGDKRRQRAGHTRRSQLVYVKKKKKKPLGRPIRTGGGRL